ncbi:phosphate-binding protein PstS 1 [Geobacter sp. OR-1]|uniref:substrate-binding domain-containing protein n=1 Tax=Geobacter sp. OR-1 TaxID=1266765 RepID=UPI000543A8A5|nr:substrate-binding domain-containing protein [Geobacter sp. OR-1]GAM11801.1 phosphate-binding protein PstS 1 [Geobacter sp. OR-1]
MKTAVQKAFMAVALIALYVASAWGNDVIKVGAGAGAPTENILKPIKEPFEKATGMQLSIVSAGVKAALLDLDADTIDAAAAGMAFPDWMNFMKKEGAEVKDTSKYLPVVLGKDRIAVIINKENPVAKLSKEQLQKIFSGEVENWKAVGGGDMPILVCWGQLQQGTNNTFIKQIMDGKAVTKDVLAVSSAHEVHNAVVANPSAIGFGPGGIVNETISAPAIPDISRDITLVTKGKPTPKVQKLIDFILGEGKKYIRQ